MEHFHLSFVKILTTIFLLRHASGQRKDIPHDLADETVMEEYEEDLHSKEIQKLASIVLDRIDKKSRWYIPSSRVVNKILRARSVTVVGITTDLIMEVCEKKNTEDTTPATTTENLTNCLVCNAEVWRKPWMRFIDVVEHNCINADHMTRLRKENFFKGNENPLE